jgi:dephospho-CoA kinase
LRVALTGGIATGKSVCLARFAACGAPTIDADVLARQAVAPGTAGFAAVRSRFGAAVIRPDGGLDRERLGQLVFADEGARRALELIIHPTVYAAIQRWFDGLAGPGHHLAAIADVPLLYESGHEGDFDLVVVAYCPAERQLARLRARSAFSEAEAKRRIAAQLPIDEKARRADVLIDTSGSIDDTHAQVDALWSRIKTGVFQRR